MDNIKVENMCLHFRIEKSTLWSMRSCSKKIIQIDINDGFWCYSPATLYNHLWTGLFSSFRKTSPFCAQCWKSCWLKKLGVWSGGSERIYWKRNTEVTVTFHICVGFFYETLWCPFSFAGHCCFNFCIDYSMCFSTNRLCRHQALGMGWGYILHCC